MNEGLAKHLRWMVPRVGVGLGVQLDMAADLIDQLTSERDEALAENQRLREALTPEAVATALHS